MSLRTARVTQNHCMSWRTAGVSICGEVKNAEGMDSFVFVSLRVRA